MPAVPSGTSLAGRNSRGVVINTPEETGYQPHRIFGMTEFRVFGVQASDGEGKKSTVLAFYRLDDQKVLFCELPKMTLAHDNLQEAFKKILTQMDSGQGTTQDPPAPVQPEPTFVQKATPVAARPTTEQVSQAAKRNGTDPL